MKRFWWHLTGQVRYRVIYSDAVRSRPLRKEEARNLAAIFDGEVVAIYPDALAVSSTGEPK